MKTVLKVTLVILVLQICLAVFTGLNLDEIPVLPSDGVEPTIWLSAWVGAFIYPGITVLFLVGGLADIAYFRKHNPTRFDRVFPPLIYPPMLYISTIQFGATLGGMKILAPNISHIVLASAVLLVAFGNVMPRVPYKSMSGLLLPWLFKSEKVWRKTQRAAGFSWVGAGVLLLLSELLFMVLHEHEMGRPLARVGAWISICLVFYPFAYSYFIYKKTRTSGDTQKSHAK